jgi:hypothetical protein
MISKLHLGLRRVAVTIWRDVFREKKNTKKFTILILVEDIRLSVLAISVTA